MCVSGLVTTCLGGGRPSFVWLVGCFLPPICVTIRRPLLADCLPMVGVQAGVCRGFARCDGVDLVGIFANCINLMEAARIRTSFVINRRGVIRRCVLQCVDAVDPGLIHARRRCHRRTTADLVSAVFFQKLHNHD